MPDIQTLTSQANCYLCYGVSFEEGLELALLKTIVQNGVGPVTGDFRITEASDPRITETGDPRIIQ